MLLSPSTCSGTWTSKPSVTTIASPWMTGDRFQYVMRKIVGKRLTYAELTGRVGATAEAFWDSATRSEVEGLTFVLGLRRLGLCTASRRWASMRSWISARGTVSIRFVAF